MAIFRWAAFALSGLAALAALPAWAYAATPAALVIDTTGTVEPLLATFTELASDAAITLQADAEIEFVHYPTCETVVVRGGRLKFTAERYLVQGGKVVSVERAECPKSVTLSGPSQIAGLVLRSDSGKDLRVETQPFFVLVGRNADQIARIVVSHEEMVLLDGEVTDRTFRWPADKPPLEKSGLYTVDLYTFDGEKAHTFEIKAHRKRRKGDMILIRLN